MTTWREKSQPPQSRVNPKISPLKLVAVGRVDILLESLLDEEEEGEDSPPAIIARCCRVRGSFIRGRVEFVEMSFDSSVVRFESRSFSLVLFDVVIIGFYRAVLLCLNLSFTLHFIQVI